MGRKLNITAANREQIVNLNRKLGLTSACQRRPLLSVPRPGPTSLPRHVFFQGAFPRVATVAITNTFWKKTWQDTHIVCKSIHCAPSHHWQKKKILLTNGLRGRLENRLPINSTSMFACLKYQIVLWSVGNSWWGCNGIFNTGLQSPGTFCPNRSGRCAARWRHGAPSFMHHGLALILSGTESREKSLQLLFVYVKPGVPWSEKARTIVGHHSNG